MPKRQYSEEFYKEVDALIKLQFERSQDRKKDIAITITGAGGEVENSASYIPSESGTVASLSIEPSNWDMIKGNQFLRYVALFSLFLVFSVFFSYQYSVYMEESGSNESSYLVTNNTAGADEVARKEVEISRSNVRITGAAEFKAWPEPRSGFLRPDKNNAEKYQSIKSEISEKKDQPVNPTEMVEKIKSPF